MLKSVAYTELYQHLKRVNDETEKEHIAISIIMPVYNEEKTIKDLLRILPNKDFIEIIVVDDNSRDNSLKKILEVKKSRELKIIRHRKNQGYGGSILTGIKQAKGNIIITMDSDGQHRPEDIYNIVKPILEDEADFTIGSRYLGQYNYELSIQTRLGEAIVERFLSLFYGINVKNNQNGFRAFDRKILHIFENTYYRGYTFATEVLIKCGLYGYRIKECPIKLYDREHGKSGIVLNKLALNISACVFRYLLKKIRLRLTRKFVKHSRLFKIPDRIFGQP